MLPPSTQRGRPLQNTILYLIGFPGTGKYTIAREICALESGFRLVDSHLINNVLFSLIPLDGKTPIPRRVWDNIHTIWDCVMDTMTHVSPQDFSFILTNYLSQNNANDIAWFATVEAMASARGARFVPVLLTIDEAEHKARITRPERTARMKETNPDAAARYAREDRLISLSHPHLLTLDVTALSPQSAAAQILAHARPR